MIRLVSIYSLLHLYYQLLALIFYDMPPKKPSKQHQPSLIKFLQNDTEPQDLNPADLNKYIDQ